jgi:hypothetical protein
LACSADPIARNDLSGRRRTRIRHRPRLPMTCPPPSGRKSLRRATPGRNRRGTPSCRPVPRPPRWDGAERNFRGVYSRTGRCRHPPSDAVNSLRRGGLRIQSAGTPNRREARVEMRRLRLRTIGCWCTSAIATAIIPAPSLMKRPVPSCSREGSPMRVKRPDGRHGAAAAFHHRQCRRPGLRASRAWTAKSRRGPRCARSPERSLSRSRASAPP